MTIKDLSPTQDNIIERDAIDEYFECITACSIDNEEMKCLTQCVEVQLKNDVKK